MRSTKVWNTAYLRQFFVVDKGGLSRVDEATRRFAPDYSVVFQPSVDGRRCALCLDGLVYSDLRSLSDQLELLGMVIVEVDLVGLARSCRDSSSYQLFTGPSDAPQLVDCSLFTWWLYQQVGISLPRYALTQRQACVEIQIESACDLHAAEAGDLIFTEGRHGYFLTDSEDAVGHVGMLTGERTVIHAANPRRGVVEDRIDDYIRQWDGFRGLGRIIPNRSQVITVEVTDCNNLILSARDIQRLLLRSMLPSKV